MKKLFLVPLIFFSNLLFAQSSTENFSIERAIAVAICNNKDMKNHLKNAGIENKEFFNEQTIFTTTEQFVGALLNKIKTKNQLQLAEIRSDLTREIQDLLLDVKTSYYSYAALKELQEYYTKKIEELSIDIINLNEQNNLKVVRSSQIKTKQTELTKAKTEIEKLHESLLISQEKLFSSLGIKNVFLKINLNKSLVPTENLDLDTLKQITLKMRPDLICLKNQVEELASYGVTQRWWKILQSDSKNSQLVFEKIEIEITYPPSIVDFKESSRAHFLGQLKQIEHIYESMWNCALLEVEDAYNHYQEALKNLSYHQKDKLSPQYTIAYKDLMISKALLEHATGQSF